MVVPLYCEVISSGFGALPLGKSDTLKYERLLLTNPSSERVLL